MGSKVKKTVRNIIPNEISKVAVKAAPIVSFFNPAAGGVLAGVGTFDQTGSISQGLRSGATTYAIGSLGQNIPSGQASGFPAFLEGAGRRAAITAASQGLRGQDINVRDALIAGAVGQGVGSLGTANFLPEPVQNFAQRTGLDIGRGITTAAGSALTDVALGRDVDVKQALLSGGLEAALTSERLKAISEKFPKPFGQETEGLDLDASQVKGVDTLEDIDGVPIRAEADADADAVTFQDKLQFGSGEEDPSLDFGVDPGLEAKQPLGQRVKTALDKRYNFSKIKEALTGPDKDIFEAVKLSAKAITRPEIFVGVPTIVAGLMAPTPEEEEEGTYDFAQRKLDVTNYLRQYGSKFYSGKELDDFIERSFAASGTAFSETLASGGRVGLAEGSGRFESAKDFIESTGDEELMDMYIDVLNGVKSEEALFKLLRKKGYQTYAVGGRVDYAEGSKDKSGIMMASAPDTMDSLNDLAQMLFGKNLDELTNDERDALDDYNRGLMAKGGMPTGIMRTNAAGIKERDYRETGGFVPVGIKEKADDVPAMLSKNEFVMTADAVRGAGNGNIEKGAQKMYDTMKELENRVA